MKLNSFFNLSLVKLIVSPMYYLVQTMIIHTHRDVILSLIYDNSVQSTMRQRRLNVSVAVVTEYIF